MHRASQVTRLRCRLPSSGLLDVGTRQPGGPAAPWQGPDEKEIKNTKQSKDGGRKTGQSISYKSGQFYLLSTVQALHYATGELFFGPEVVEDQLAVAA